MRAENILRKIENRWGWFESYRHETRNETWGEWHLHSTIWNNDTVPELIYDIFCAPPFAAWNYVNKARTSGCCYTPPKKKKREDRTTGSGDMHCITGHPEHRRRRLSQIIYVSAVVSAHSTGYQSRRGEKMTIFFHSNSSSISITFLCVGRCWREARRRASSSFEGAQMEKICLNWDNNEN